MTIVEHFNSPERARPLNAGDAGSLRATDTVPVLATPVALAAGVAACAALAGAFVGGFNIGQAVG